MYIRLAFESQKVYSSFQKLYLSFVHYKSQEILYEKSSMQKNDIQNIIRSI